MIAFEKFEARLQQEARAEAGIPVSGKAGHPHTERRAQPKKRGPGRPPEEELSVPMTLNVPADLAAQCEVLAELTEIPRAAFLRALVAAGAAALVRHLEAGARGIVFPLRLAVDPSKDAAPARYVRIIDPQRFEACSRSFSPGSPAKWQARAERARKYYGTPEPAPRPTAAPHYMPILQMKTGQWTYTTPISHAPDFPDVDLCKASIRRVRQEHMALAEDPAFTAAEILAAYFDSEPSPATPDEH